MSCFQLNGNLTGSANANLSTASLAGSFLQYPPNPKTLMDTLACSLSSTSSLQGTLSGSLIASFRGYLEQYYGSTTYYYTFELTGELSSSADACIFFPPLT